MKSHSALFALSFFGIDVLNSTSIEKTGLYSFFIATWLYRTDLRCLWNYVVNWIASNSAHFINPNAPVNTLYPPKEVSPIYGLIEKEKVTGEEFDALFERITAQRGLTEGEG